MSWSLNHFPSLGSFERYVRSHHTCNSVFNLLPLPAANRPVSPPPDCACVNAYSLSRVVVFARVSVILSEQSVAVLLYRCLFSSSANHFSSFLAAVQSSWYPSAPDTAGDFMRPYHSPSWSCVSRNMSLVSADIPSFPYASQNICSSRQM